jgi:hypothetical protein
MRHGETNAYKELSVGCGDTDWRMILKWVRKLVVEM